MGVVFRLPFDVTANVAEGASVALDASDNQIPFTAMSDHPLATSIFVTKQKARVGNGSLNIVVGTRSFLTADDPRLVIGDNDFQFSCWFWATTLPSGEAFLWDSRITGGTGPGFALYTEGGRLSFYDGRNAFNSAIGITEKAWHCAVVQRKAGVVRLYLDGALVLTCPCAFTLTSSQITLFAAQYTPQGINSMEGYFDEAVLLMGNVTPVFVPHPSTANFTRLLKA